MVGHFKERIAGAFEHIEPWFIASVAFNPKKHQVDIHIGVRKATDIVCPYCRRVTPYHIYEPHRNLIASVENTHSNNVISRFDYTNDSIGRRTAITRTGFAFSSLSGSIDHYGYNDRSELVSARRTLNGEEVRGFSFGYAYDSIGNRTSSTEWDENGIPHTSHYMANELNEYESRTVPGHVTVLGEASTNAIVTVNGNPTWRKGAYFIGGDNFDNTSSSVFAELTTTGVRSTTESDEVESSIGHKFLAQTPETFTYDADGNMTSDGRFNYTWDAENRLISTETRGDLAPEVPRVRVSNKYDHQFRRIGKSVSTNTISQYTNKFYYDDWNIIYETNLAENKSTNIYHVWGLDINGELNEGDGIGSLLGVANEDTFSFACTDMFGSVSEFFVANTSSLFHADYSPVGEVIAESGVAISNHRYHGNFFDIETSTLAYGYRYYSQKNGKWLSRDPFGENGGINLTGHCRNNSLYFIDYLGLCVQIITAGDSLTYGSQGWNKRETDSFPGYLKFFDNSNLCQDICMYGMNGAKTHEIANTKIGNCSCLSSCPEAFFVFVMTGMNDALGFNDRDEDVKQGRFKKRKEDLLNRAKNGWNELRNSLINQVETMTPSGCNPRKVMIIIEPPHVKHVKSIWGKRENKLRDIYKRHVLNINSVLASLFDYIQGNRPGEEWEVEFVRTNPYMDEKGKRHNPDVPLVHTTDDDGVHFEKTKILSSYLKRILNQKGDETNE